MAPFPNIPSTISSYCIFPIVLPALASNPVPATHFLYIKPDEPKVPIYTTNRSLFLVNVPSDATALHLRHLFSKQLSLPSGRIESVEFEGKRPSSSRPEHEFPRELSLELANRVKKRKREAEMKDSKLLEEAKFPATRDRESHQSGSTAVVVFVDRASMEATIKAIKLHRKEKRRVTWGEGLENRVPVLGSTSKVLLYLMV